MYLQRHGAPTRSRSKWGSVDVSDAKLRFVQPGPCPGAILAFFEKSRKIQPYEYPQLGILLDSHAGNLPHTHTKVNDSHIMAVYGWTNKPCAWIWGKWSHPSKVMLGNNSNNYILERTRFYSLENKGVFFLSLCPQYSLLRSKPEG